MMLKTLLVSWLFLYTFNSTHAAPQSIHWGTRHNPLNGLTVSWISTGISDSIKWGYTETCETGSFPGTQQMNPQKDYTYHFEFPVLMPSSTVYYALKGTAWGPVKTFQTATDTLTGRFSFIAGGDSRSVPTAWQTVANRIGNEPVDFHLFLGDHVDVANSREEWDGFLRNGKGLLENNLVFHTGGNHDFGLYYLNLLVNPRNESVAPMYERWYSFEYGNALFISLLSETLFDTQHAWLVNLLESNTKKWVVVFFHKPVFTGTTWDNSMLNYTDTWWKAFDDYGVDVVLNGHDHFYMRSKPINLNVSTGSPVAEYGSGPGQGRLEVIAGGYGAPLMDMPTDWFVEEFRKDYNYCKFEINDNVLNLKAYTGGGILIDDLTITKSQPRIDRSGCGENSGIHVHPNPFKTAVTIKLPRYNKGMRLAIYNVKGEKVFHRNNLNGRSVVWYENNLPSGVYYIFLKAGNRLFKKEIILLK
jgi:hypothetical protein